ncbi:hypothetical protein LJB94_00175 [Odoribacter sp. OttesenSCG-928-G04]|nr:hypothetical protein [Odoribacter sp. OttesenSCG-928-G04]
MGAILAICFFSAFLLRKHAEQICSRKLEAGKQYTISITVNKTSVSTGTIAVADWTLINGSGSIDY